MQRNFTRRDIEFDADGITLRGWLYVPESNGHQVPAIVMAHGYSAVKEMYLDRYAEVFAQAGLAALVFDYRGFGASDGMPRQEVNPWQQIEDYRHAITYASMMPEVDNNRIGVWGSSYSGGHVLVVAATDRRVKCVVSQVPTISGYQSALRRVPGEAVEKLLHSFAEDRVRRMKGEEPQMLSVIPHEADGNAIYTMPDAVKWYSEGGALAPGWRNEVTLRSVEFSRSYEPGIYVSRISPTPLLMIVGENDYVTPTDLALEAYENALQPKRLALLSGGHFDPYLNHFEQSSTEAVKWFSQHLLK
ncbi:alpha/beta hydrolase [Aneurinibacillus uraniidurans]|uniref:alpha/beta hydrolase n=1 Tax=Aneurinibacillus uraniidurans TaxID=2966586 RepID=UPI00234B2230|nr:alpha/beta hydrolase [Aneurinibacillus sp. B1]WCN37648.1 alpha/beta hydrolase [Aneurinibacillus sp. B1]